MNCFAQNDMHDDMLPVSAKALHGGKRLGCLESVAAWRYLSLGLDALGIELRAIAVPRAPAQAASRQGGLSQ